MLFHHTVVLILLSLLAFSCGVKGKPLPPLEPPYIGNGKTVQENENIKKKNQNDPKTKAPMDHE